jgi:cytoskeletal protein RodZ
MRLQELISFHKNLTQEKLALTTQLVTLQNKEQDIKNNQQTIVQKETVKMKKSFKWTHVAAAVVFGVLSGYLIFV